jgi:hypothetical protein
MKVSKRPSGTAIERIASEVRELVAAFPIPGVSV